MFGIKQIGFALADGNKTIRLETAKALIAPVQLRFADGGTFDRIYQH